MKKIIPFLLFVPLLILSIYIGYTQFNNKKQENNIINTTSNGVKKSTHTSIDAPDFSSPTPKQETANASINQISLTISSPESGTVVDANTVTISGFTESNASIVINDTEIAANNDGSFQSDISLDEGDNYISIVAYNDAGSVAEREIIVTRTITGL